MVIDGTRRKAPLNKIRLTGHPRMGPFSVQKYPRRRQGLPKALRNVRRTGNLPFAC